MVRYPCASACLVGNSIACLWILHPKHTFMRARMRGRGVRCRPLSCAAAAAAAAVCAGFVSFGLGQVLDRPLGDVLHAAAVVAAADNGLRLVTS
jgi:hypothetical protein